MALSFHPTADTGFVFGDQHSGVADAHFAFCEPLEASHLAIDTLFNTPNDDIYLYDTSNNPTLLPSFSEPSLLSLPPDLYSPSEEYLALLPSFSEPSLLSLSPDLYSPSEEYLTYQCPKRPRSCGDLYHPPTTGYNARMTPEFLPAFVAPQPVVSEAEQKAVNASVSTQSMAARERRKRISDNIRELGRLIPGGHKMNTAEMLQAAFNYVKFLQAQVGILGLISSAEEQLHVLLSSSKVHEKLYIEGKCMVPDEMVEDLLQDSEIKQSQIVLRDLGCFAKLVR